MRVLVLAALVAGATGVGSGVPAGSSPSAPDYYAVTIRMHSFNICSKDCGPGNGVQARDLVVWWHGADPPWAIALQETCRSDMIDILNRTGMAAANMGYATMDHSGCNGNTASLRDFGNAIFRSGSTPSVAQRHQFPTQENDPCSLSNESHKCRNAVCVPMNSYAGVLNVCSTHLSADRDPFAETQANELIWIVNATYGSGGKFMMGDFNLNTAQMPNVFYDQYYRAPQAWTYEADPSLRAEQLDFIWHDRAHTLSQTLLSPHCDPYYSDHCFVRARVF